MAVPGDRPPVPDHKLRAKKYPPPASRAREGIWLDFTEEKSVLLQLSNRPYLFLPLPLPGVVVEPEEVGVVVTVDVDVEVELLSSEEPSSDESP